MRKIALTPVHEFAVSGSKYSSELSTSNVRRGIFRCVLHENGIAALMAKSRASPGHFTVAGNGQH